jgi:hypothetical protein
MGGTNATTAGAALTNLGAAPIASPSFTGNVTIGGTSIFTGGNAAAMLVANEFGQFSSFYSPDGSAANGGIIYGNSANPVCTYANGTHTFYNRTRTTAYCIFDTTNTRNVSGAWATISDGSAKEAESIRPYTRGLEALLALEPVHFRYRKGTPFAPEDEPSRELVGLMADQVKLHVPEIVGRTTFPAKAGSDESPTTLDTIEPGNLIYPVIIALKELAARIEALEARLEGDKPAPGARH